uniref:Uncharacterized protein n=1 Tax=Anopheles minimus TaxID=112268 RepID=A0A182WQ91_9DIPT
MTRLRWLVLLGKRLRRSQYSIAR